MIDLTKVAQRAPQMVDLTKRAGVSIEKAGLADHTAAVLLVIDVSPSADHLFRSGAMQAVAAQAFAVALNFDDDGNVPVAAFDRKTSYLGDMDLDNCAWFIDTQTANVRDPMGGTHYAEAIRWCRDTARMQPPGMPTYVIFVTDGEPNDSAREIESELIEASREPLFFSFVGVGYGVGSPRKGASFPYLERLDDLRGRQLDNASFFSVAEPNSVSDEDMLDAMLTEYPGWVQRARQLGIIR